MPNVITVYDQRRGCGWRAGGGLYLRSDELGVSCGKLPLLLDRCPVCNGGVKFSRSMTFINPKRLFDGAVCKDYLDDPAGCDTCPVSSRNIPERGWLMGVGEKHYTMGSFIAEALRLGVSKRIPQIPRDFKLGQDYVFLSYKKAITRYLPAAETVDPKLPDDFDEDQEALPLEEPQPITEQAITQQQYPGVFSVFRPTKIEYVVKGDEDDEVLERLEKRGITLVKVERVEEKQLEMSNAS